MNQGLTPDKLARFDALLRKKGIPAPEAIGIPRRPAGAPAPLTTAQRRVWALHQLAPDSPAYNMRLAEHISGSFSRQHLSVALNHVIARHEMLRTTFTLAEGVPFQTVAADLTVSIPVTDVTGLDQAKEAATAFVRQPFDLTTLPLLRAHVWRWAPTDQLLVVVSHQILFDGASLGLLLSELKRNYGALSAGSTPANEPLPIQYGDYAVWAAERTSVAALNEQTTYWSARLRPPYRPVALPYDRPRPATETYAGGLTSFAVDSDTTTALKQLSRQEGTTLFATLAAALAALFHGYGSSGEVMLFASAEGRHQPEVQGLIGLLARQIVLRQPVTGTMSFRDLLAAAAASATAATANSDVDFEALVSMMQLEPGQPPAALFQVMMLLLGQNTESAAPSAASSELSWQGIHVGNQMAKFDWRLFFIDGAARLTGLLEFKRDLFTDATIERSIGELQAVFAAVVAQPDVPIADILPFPAGRYDRWTTGATAPSQAIDDVNAPNVVTKTGYISPRGSLEWQLAQIWETLFDRHPIGIADNFFAMGGHSLLAVQLFARIETQLGQRLPLRLLAECPTIEQLAEALAADGWQGRWRSLVPMKPDGDRPPLFAVPPAGRSVASMSLLTHFLAPEQPFYAFQPLGLEPGERAVSSVPEMAAAYVAEMRTLQPAGPYYLMGRCFGGLVAVEMGRQLLAMGEGVPMLAVIDTLLPPRRGMAPASRDAAFYRRRLLERARHDPGRLLKRGWNTLVAEPGRNLQKSYYSARDSFVWASDQPWRIKENLTIWRRLTRLLSTHLRAGQDYFLDEPYPGKITFFASEATPPIESEFHWSWPALAGDGFENHIVPGDHVSMAAPENVAVMAQLITDCLAQTQPTA